MEKGGLFALSIRSGDNLELKEAQRGHREDKEQPAMGPGMGVLLFAQSPKFLSFLALGTITVMRKKHTQQNADVAC